MKHPRPSLSLFSLTALVGLLFCLSVPRALAQIIGPTRVHTISFRATQAADIAIAQNNTGPVLDAILEGADGKPVDLTGGTAILEASGGGAGAPTLISAPCAIVSPAAGEIKYAWQPADTAILGTYALTIAATLADGTQVTFPSDHALRLVISAGNHFAQSGTSPPAGQVSGGPIGANTISSDGAYGTNAAFEAGQSTYYLVELQKYGADYVEAGITQENPALISKGLLMLDWGFNHEATDGSFPGAGSIPINSTNANSATGGVFHDVSLFFEAGNRAVIDLENYHPVTYTLDPSTYSGKIASYEAQLHLIAQWLSNTAWTPPGASSAVNVGALGQSYDAQYSHRFALLAAGFQECSVVTGDTTLVPIANSWIDQLFPKQLPTGWTAAIPTSALTTPTPATLLPPATGPPAGTAYTIPVPGVYPERTSFDVSYQMVDALHQTRYYNNSTDAGRKAQIVTSLIAALAWERSRQAPNSNILAGLPSGAIDPTGSSRVGIDATAQVTVPGASSTKSLAGGEVLAAFQAGGAIDGKGRDLLAGIRFRDQSLIPNPDPIAASGAIGNNVNYDNDNTAAINISLQKDGADWVQAGCLHEFDAQIATGENILNWGIGAATPLGSTSPLPGSFPTTGSPYSDPATFLEADARSTLMVENYRPISHTASVGVTSIIPSYIAAVDLIGNYLTTPSMLTGGYVSTTSASKIMTYAAALGEAAVVCATSNPSDSAKFKTQSNTFLTQALALQLTDGTFGESGSFSGNAQATSCLMADRLAQWGTFTTPSQATLLTAITKGLTKMESVVNVDGSFTYSSPATQTTANAFTQGAAVTGNAAYNVVYHRIVDPSLPGE